MKGPLGRGRSARGTWRPIPNRSGIIAEIPRGPSAGVNRAKAFATLLDPEADLIGERNGSYARTVISWGSLTQSELRLDNVFWPPRIFNKSRGIIEVARGSAPDCI